MKWLQTCFKDITPKTFNALVMRTLSCNKRWENLVFSPCSEHEIADPHISKAVVGSEKNKKNQTLWHNNCFTQTISYLTITGSPHFPTASLKADKTVEDRLFVERVKNVITLENPSVQHASVQLHLDATAPYLQLFHPIQHQI